MPVYLQDWPLAVPDEAVPHLYQLARRLGTATHWDAPSGTLHIESALYGRTIALDCAAGTTLNWMLVDALRRRLETAGAQVVQMDGVVRPEAWLRVALVEVGSSRIAGPAVLLPRLSLPRARRLAGHVAAALSYAFAMPVVRRWAGWWPALTPGVTLVGPGMPLADDQVMERVVQALATALVRFFRPGAPALTPSACSLDPPLFYGPVPAARPAVPGATAPAGATADGPPPAAAAPMTAAAEAGGSRQERPTGQTAVDPVYVWSWTCGYEAVRDRTGRC